MILPPNFVHLNQWEVPPIQNLSQREIDQPEGVGFDLRLDRVYRIAGQGALLSETRQTSSSAEIAPSKDDIYELRRKEWYLVSTKEIINLPSGIAGMIFPRSTLFRSGVSLHTSVVPPGYVGPLVFGLEVHTNDGFLIERFARFCHIVLYEVAEGGTPYRGQWSGGRISQGTPEGQV